jgi:hypothetical protein
MNPLITPESTLTHHVPRSSEPKSTREDGGIERRFPPRDELLGAGQTLNIPVPESPPEHLLLNVVMTFADASVRLNAIDAGISVEAGTVQEAFRRLVAAVRDYVASAKSEEAGLLRYAPNTWFKFVPPNQIAAEQETSGEETEENAIHDHDIPDLDALAEAQGVEPIGDIDELVADFWPEDESEEDFMAAVRRWRDEGSRQHD